MGGQMGHMGHTTNSTIKTQLAQQQQKQQQQQQQLYHAPNSSAGAVDSVAGVIGGGSGSGSPFTAGNQLTSTGSALTGLTSMEKLAHAVTSSTSASTTGAATGITATAGLGLLQQPSSALKMRLQSAGGMLNLNSPSSHTNLLHKPPLSGCKSSCSKAKVASAQSAQQQQQQQQQQQSGGRS